MTPGHLKMTGTGMAPTKSPCILQLFSIKVAFVSAQWQASLRCTPEETDKAEDEAGPAARTEFIPAFFTSQKI